MVSRDRHHSLGRFSDTDDTIVAGDQHDDHTSVDHLDVVEPEHRPGGFGEEGNPPFPLPGGLGPAYPPTPDRVAEPGEDRDRSGLRRPENPD